MNRYVGILAGVLAVQLLVAAGMSFTGPSLAAFRPDVPLFDLAGRAVDRLTIESAEDGQVVLARKDDGWVLPHASDFPADTAKVDDLIQQLQDLKRGMAVATSASAHQRFKVTDDEFERRLVLASGDETLATLYLGSSPRVREVHARTSDDAAIYSVPIGVYEVPADQDDWLDTTVLQVPLAEIDKVTLPGFSLSRVTEAASGDDATAQESKDSAPRWTLDSSSERLDADAIDQVKANELVRKLAQLSIDSVLGTESLPEYGLGEPVLVASLQRGGAGMEQPEQIEYRLGKREKENDYVLKSSLRDEHFRIAGYLGDALVEAAARERLLRTTDDGTEPETLPEAPDAQG